VHDLLLLDELLAPLGPLDTLAVVMAGGEGRRLLPLTQSTPKPLLKVGGKPLVEILINRLREAGIPEVLVSVHHKSDMIAPRSAMASGSAYVSSTSRSPGRSARWALWPSSGPVSIVPSSSSTATSSPSVTSARCGSFICARPTRP
jgi:hypothetical protein